MFKMIHQLFPTFVYQAPLGSIPLGPRSKKIKTENFNKDLLKEIYKISEIDLAGKKWSQKNYKGGFTSYGSMAQLYRFSSSFDHLRQEIDGHVAKFIKSLEMDVSPKELRMRTCWVNIMPQNTTHSMHIHPLSVISGTYYVKIPKGSSGLKLEDPRLTNFMASPPRKNKASLANQRFMTLSPRPGDVILFESWMRHEVPPQPMAGDRVSVSFNYDWLP